MSANKFAMHTQGDSDNFVPYLRQLIFAAIL